MDLDQAFRTAHAFHQAGRLADAEKIYLEVLHASPAHASALHLLGLIKHQLGMNADAVDLIDRSLQLQPANPAGRNSLGMALGALGKHQLAEQSFRSALAQRPDYPEAHNNLANTLYALGRVEDAALHYQTALTLLPDAAAVHNNLGKALTDLGRFEEAEQSFRRALALSPGFVEANNDLGILFQRRGKPAQAAQFFRRALALNPDDGNAHSNLANTLKELGSIGESERHYRRALELSPASVQAHVNLGTLLHERGFSVEARQLLARAVELSPQDVSARWSLAMAQLTAIPSSQQEVDAGRASFALELAKLIDWSDQSASPEAYVGVGAQRPFYLAYQETDNRALLSRYGQLCARVMQKWQSAQDLTMLPPAAGGPLKVGIVSAQISNHSVWNAIVKGWLRHLDRGNFSIHLFSINPKFDDETAIAKSLASRFETGSRSLARWAESIRTARLDVLIFPEIGMDLVTLQLASLRLAPVQIASWGHPETSGLPTIDYFLSAEYLEPADAQDNYTERLVTLPNLGCCYQPSPEKPAAPDLAGMGIDPAMPLLICPGTPFKYAPAHDRTLVEIARRLGRCQMIFFSDAPDGLWRLLHRRLERAFAQSSLRFADYGIFVPWQPRPSFYGLMKRASLFLDTIGFSGFNTAMQAVECGLPIVTREGRFMRGRLASAILKRIGLHELVAASDDEYVGLAVKLATDTAFRGRIRATLEARAYLLYDDQFPVRALENFLTEVTRLNSPSARTGA
jgi:protein O-GlcNAc transferase